MARKKKSRPMTRKRGRVGATSKNDLMGLLYMVGGAVAAKLVVKQIPDNIGGTDISKFKSAIPVAIGFFAPKFVKSPALAPLFKGMVVGGALQLAEQAGIGYLSAPMVGGYGYNEPMLLNGIGEVSNSSTTPFIGSIC